jgi:hypothetical protein
MVGALVVLKLYGWCTQGAQDVWWVHCGVLMQVCVPLRRLQLPQTINHTVAAAAATGARAAGAA